MWLPLLFVSGCFICFTVWCNWRYPITLLWWRHNGQDSAWNHQPHHCLLNHLFIRRSKKTSKLRVTGLFVGNSPGTDEFPEQMAVTRKMYPFDDVIMSLKSQYEHPLVSLYSKNSLFFFYIHLYINHFIGNTGLIFCFHSILCSWCRLHNIHFSREVRKGWVGCQEWSADAAMRETTFSHTFPDGNRYIS